MIVSVVKETEVVVFDGVDAEDLLYRPWWREPVLLHGGFELATAHAREAGLSEYIGEWRASVHDGQIEVLVEAPRGVDPAVWEWVAVEPVLMALRLYNTDARSSATIHDSHGAAWVRLRYAVADVEAEHAMDYANLN